MRKLMLAATAFIAFLATPALAADLPVKAPPPAPVAAINWTGIYIGGHAGSSWSDSHWLTNHVAGVGPCLTSGFITPCDPVNASASGFAGGGQIGGRWQTGAWVFGVEGTWTGYDLSTQTGSFAQIAGGVPVTLVYDTKIRDTYTATAQAGYAWNRALFYVKGGYAGGRLDLNSQTLPLPGAFAPVRVTANGWTAGVGAEYSFTPNLSVGVEYNRIHLTAGDVATCTNGVASVFSCGAPGALPLRYTEIRTDIDQVLVRLNYRFNWLSGPVVAKY